MIAHFEKDSRLGAAGFRVHLADGSEESAALPGVFVGCGVGFRAEALRGVGGLDSRLFMQAEEYDLCFRLLAGGWRIKVFGDLHVEHGKSPHARKSDRTAYFDIRNNLRVVARYLPEPHFDIYWQDTLQRYEWLAQRNNHLAAYRRGRRTGQWLSLLERQTYRRRRVRDEVLETMYRWTHARERMTELASSGVRKIVLADLGKNVYAFVRGALESDITVCAIGDDRFTAPGRQYRGIPVLPLDHALAETADAVVIANMSFVHGTNTYRQLIDRRLRIPLHWWFAAPLETSDRASPLPHRRTITAAHAVDV